MTIRSNSQAHPYVTPMGRNGLRGKTAVDMRGRPWSGFLAIRQGGGTYWWFRCPRGHEALICGRRVRKLDREGLAPRCPECAALTGKPRLNAACLEGRP